MKLFSEFKAEIRRIDRDDKSLKKFGLLVGGILVIFGFLLWGRFLVGFGVPGGLLAIAGLFFPRFLLWPYLLWMGFAVVAGFFVSRIILVVIFYLLLVPTGLIMRLFKGDPLDQKIDKDKESYWIKRGGPYEPKNSEQMY